MRALGIVVAAALLAGLAGCGGKASPAKQSRQTFKIGYAFGFDAGDTADRIGFDRLAKRGVAQVRIVDMGGPANAIAALLHGDVDMAIVTYSGAVEAIANGAGIRLVLGQTMAPEFLLVARPEIAHATDLKGKTVVDSGPGSTTELLAKLVAKRAGLDPADVTYRAILDSPAKAAALVRGSADAASIEFVDYQRLKLAHPGLHLLGRMADLQPPSPASVWAVSRKRLAQNPERIRTIVNALLDGYAFTYTDAGRKAWIAEAARTSLQNDKPELVRRTYDFYRGIHSWPQRDRPVTKAQHERIVDFWLKTGLIEKGAPYAEVWDTRFWAPRKPA